MPKNIICVFIAVKSVSIGSFILASASENGIKRNELKMSIYKVENIFAQNIDCGYSLEPP